MIHPTVLCYCYTFVCSYDMVYPLIEGINKIYVLAREKLESGAARMSD